METTLAFFSSDASPLYKADVFRVLALPEGYTIQFRYEKKYVHADVLQRLQETKDRAGVVLFVAGNDIKVPEPDGEVSIHSIRSVVVQEVAEAPEIDSIIFVLRVGQFSDCQPHQGTSVELLPPSSFVSEICVDIGPNHQWIARVKEVAPHFPDLLFYSIQGLTRNDTAVAPVYSTTNRASVYELEDESEYQMSVSFYDCLEGMSGLCPDMSGSKDVHLLVPSNHRVGAKKDNTKFTLNTTSLNQQASESHSRLLIASGKKDVNTADYFLDLRWRVRRHRFKPLWFGLWSGVTSAGVLCGSLATPDLCNIGWNVTAAIASFVLVAVGAGSLYFFFNKK